MTIEIVGNTINGSSGGGGTTTTISTPIIPASIYDDFMSYTPNTNVSASLWQVATGGSSPGNATAKVQTVSSTIFGGDVNQTKAGVFTGANGGALSAYTKNALIGKDIYFRGLWSVNNETGDLRIGNNTDGWTVIDSFNSYVNAGGSFCIVIRYAGNGSYNVYNGYQVTNVNLPNGVQILFNLNPSAGSPGSVTVTIDNIRYGTPGTTATMNPALYDQYDSSIDTNKWTTASVIVGIATATETEDNNRIILAASTSTTSSSGTARATTKIDLKDKEYLFIFYGLDANSVLTGGGSGQTYVSGDNSTYTLLQTRNVPGNKGTITDYGAYTVGKNNHNGTWSFWNSGIIYGTPDLTVTVTNSLKIRFDSTASVGVTSGSGWSTMYVYPILYL